MVEEERILELERRVSELEHEVHILSDWRQKHIDKAKEKAMQVGSGEVHTTGKPLAGAVFVAENDAYEDTTGIPSKRQEPSFEIKAVENKRNNNTRPKKQEGRDSDFESFIGKRLFTVVASVLIFIGVIVFAGVLLPYLTEGMKFGLMCLVSLAFTVFSYFYNKKRNDNFSAGLLACSLGTVYVTLFTGNLYFRFVDTLALYFGLLLWVLMIYFCSRSDIKYRLLFNIIGQAGILISLFICIPIAHADQNDLSIMCCTVFVIVSEVLYGALFSDEGYLLNILSSFVCMMFLSFPVIQVAGEGLSGYDKVTISQFFFEGRMDKIVMFILFVLFFVSILVRMMMPMAKRGMSQITYFIVALASVVSFFVSVNRFEWDITVVVLELAYVLFMFVITERVFYDEERHALVDVFSCVLYALMFILHHSLCHRPFSSFWTGAGQGFILPDIVLVIPMVFYVYKSRTKCSKAVINTGIIAGIVMNLFYVFDRYSCFVLEVWNYNESGPMVSRSNVVYYVLLVFFTVLLYLLMEHLSDGRPFVSILSYLMVVLNISGSFLFMSRLDSHMFDPNMFYEIKGGMRFASLFIIVCIQLWFWSNGFFDRDGNHFDKPGDVLKQRPFGAYFAVNIMAMLIALCYLYGFNKVNIWYFLVVILSLILFNLDDTLMLSVKNTPWAVYVGIKIAVLVLAVMRVFNVQPLVSVILFIWAVACVVIGLNKEQKPMRIHGLVLALISSAKLILVDISYNNSLSRAASFLVCGGLCFVISYIYHRIEKTNVAGSVDMKDENNEQQ